MREALAELRRHELRKLIAEQVKACAVDPNDKNGRVSVLPEWSETGQMAHLILSCVDRKELLYCIEERLMLEGIIPVGGNEWTVTLKAPVAPKDRGVRALGARG